MTDCHICKHDLPHTPDTPQQPVTSQHHHQHARAGSACCASPAEPATPATLPPAETHGTQTRTALRIMQMDCPTEEGLIRSRLGHMPAVQHMEFNLIQRILTIMHEPDSLPQILAALHSLGFTAETPEPAAHPNTPAASSAARHPLWPVAIASLLALGSEAAHWANLPGAISALLAIAAILTCGLNTYKKGWIALRNANLNINALMSIAVTGAFILGEWPEAAMVMTLFTLAELIEARSLDRTRNAIGALMQLAPDTALVRQPAGDWLETDAAKVTTGSIVRVKPGARIALDGEIIQGRSTINQAPITGESLPVDKAEGDPVFAGTINEAGAFDYRVTATANHSTLARIIDAVEQAQNAKAPTQRFVDQFARIYTPIIFSLAVAIALLPPLLSGGDWHEWIYKALVLLVIACPCALVISTPVTVVSGLTAAARRGILIKGGVYLEEGRKLDWLVFDKTGTLTHGKPVQTDFELLSDTEHPDACHRFAVSLASHSDHPVSKAIAQAGMDTGISPENVEQFEALPGRGTSGLINGQRFLLGNHRLVEEQGLCSPALEARLNDLESSGKTVVILMNDQQALALFAVADTVKETSQATIETLHQLGIRTVMLTGDNPHTAHVIGTQVGIDDIRGNQLPEDKLAAIRHLSTRGKTGMVGDGINDAPALAQAHIGFAMGAIGTDTAIETADVALMDDDLRKLPAFIRLSRRTHTILIQNITLAIGIKTVFLLLTLLGIGTLWMAVFADVGASLLVVGNGLRLLRA